MRSYLKYGKKCKQKAIGGCKICKQIWTLLCIHDEHCQTLLCPMSECIAIWEGVPSLQNSSRRWMIVVEWRWISTIDLVLEGSMWFEWEMKITAIGNGYFLLQSSGIYHCFINYIKRLFWEKVKRKIVCNISVTKSLFSSSGNLLS